MKLSEVLSIEEHNSGVIHLIKDGLFWRAYEMSSDDKIRWISKIITMFKSRHEEQVKYWTKCYKGISYMRPFNALPLEDEILVGNKYAVVNTKSNKLII